MEEKQLKINQSVEKAFSIIEVMSQDEHSMRLQDIAKKVQMPQTTALRIIYTLMKLGYIMQNEETLQYSLTLKFSLIGNRVEDKLEIRDLIKPHLLAISRECGEASCLSIKDEEELLYIDSVDGQDSLLKVTQKIGKRAPLYCTGAGKIYLANMSRDGLKEYLKSYSLEKLTDNTITTYDALSAELTNIGEQGYSLDQEECELGVKCIAVAVRDYKGKIIATVSVSGPIGRMTNEKMLMIYQKVSKHVAKIEKVLAYS